MTATFTSFELVCAIESSCQARLACLEATQAELFRVDAIEKFVRYFTKFTTMDTARLLYGLRGEAIDVPSFFFGKLPLAIASFLPLFAFLRREFRAASADLQVNVRLVVASTKFTPASRDRAMKGIEGGGEGDLCGILAAAETDDVDAIVSEVRVLVGSNP
jgi:hypothetical protein